MSQPAQPTTQQFLDIFDITNDILILKDGATASILSVDAMNFGLLAEEEQDGVMYAYAGLLNSLNYPIQVVIQSKTKDVTTYLRKLQDQEEIASTDTMRRRIGEYRKFVSNLIHERNVLDKHFYVVIPASSLEMGFLTAQSFKPGKQSFDVSSIERSVILEKATNILDPRRDHLMSQFARIGLFSRPLKTQEIIQLFYVSYNPEAVEGQEIADSQSYTSPLVHAQMDTPTLGISQPTAVPQSPLPTETIPVAQPQILPSNPGPLQSITLEQTTETTQPQQALQPTTPAQPTASVQQSTTVAPQPSIQPLIATPPLQVVGAT